MLKIGNLSLTSSLILAPMEGLTDSPTRRIIRSLGGCGLVVTEFISTEGLLRNVPSETKKLEYDPEEQPLAVQIAGKEPGRVADAAAMVQDAGAAICDLNMGCPSRKVMRNGVGAALLDQPELVRQIMRATRARLNIPLTVKLRLGVACKSRTFLSIAKICEAEGADAITLHARTARQQYGGDADWTEIRALKEIADVPVIGNGDVLRPEDALRMVEETGCDGVMIGRAAIANPWIFQQITALSDGTLWKEPSLIERRDLLRRHTELVIDHYPVDGARFHQLRVLIRSATHGLPGGRHLRRQLSLVGSFDVLTKRIDEFFEALITSASDQPPHQ
ncbi:MAG: tRNA dihydrouridine synthase DusB [bacterium]|nr:tRNA dihydrouridine synthase DusB [bacterium]